MPHLKCSLECICQQARQLLLVDARVARSRRGVWRTACVANLTLLVLERLHLVAESRLSKWPNTVVFVFFLWPANWGVFVLLEWLLECVERPGGKLLNSHDGNVFDSELLSLINQVVVDLASAVDNLANLVSSHQVLVVIIDDALESCALGEIFDVGSRTSKFQQFFRCHDNERLSKRSAHLAS